MLSAFVVALAGCLEVDHEPTDRAASPILNGADDATHLGVVAVESTFELCSGFIIAPDLVLTARHCVGDLTNPMSPCVAVNGGTTVTPGPLWMPSQFKILQGVDIVKSPGPAMKVAEVIVPTDATTFCGNDVALLRLETAVDPTLAYALRLDSPPVVGEALSAIGYGQSIAGPDTTSGVRRSRDGLAVSKVGPSLPRFVDGEWTISEGPCGGDSGSPAVDAEGRAIGVMSRGNKSTCVDMVYERVDTHADWLRAQASASYQRAGVAVPPWVDPNAAAGGAGGGGGAGGAAPKKADPKTDESGCAIVALGVGDEPLGAPCLVAVGLACAVARRRARRYFL